MKEEGNGNTLESFGGMPHEDWAAGKLFPPKSEDRLHTCPAWWYQLADYSRKPNWKECGSAFDTCPLFHRKAECWNRFDAEESAPQFLGDREG